MAKRGTLPLWKRPPLFRNVVIAQINRGQIHFQKWPRKRGRAKSPITREQNAKFKEANYLVKFADGQARWWAERVAKGGPVYPRDLLLSAMYGRLFEVLMIDGQEWYSMPLKADISHDLDVVGGSLLGTLLVRGTTGWQALVPTAAGFVLTSGGPAALPGYQPAGGAAVGASFIAQNSYYEAAPAGYACKGLAFEPGVQLTVIAALAIVDEISTATYRMQLWSLTGDDLNVKIAETPERTAPATATYYWYSGFVSAAVITPGTEYFICHVRTDGLDTDASGVRYANEDLQGFPFAARPELSYIIENDPLPGDTIVRAAPPRVYNLFIITG